MPWWWSTRSGISANICQIMLLLIPLRCWIQVFVRYIQFSIIHSRFQRQHMHVNVIIRWPKATSVFQVLSRRPELLCGFMSKYDKLYLRLSICTNWNYFCIIPLKYLTTTQNRTQSGGKMYRDTIENYFNAVSVFWCQVDNICHRWLTYKPFFSMTGSGRVFCVCDICDMFSWHPRL